MDVIKAAIIEPVGGHGGMDYYDFGLCSGLNLNGVYVVLYTCNETRENEAFITKKVYRKIYGNDSSLIRGLRYLLGTIMAAFHAKKMGVQIWHLHLFNVGILEVFNILVGKLLRFRIVITTHDVESFAPGTSFFVFERFVYRLTNSIVAHNQISKKTLVEKLNVAENKICIIPHGNYIQWAKTDIFWKDARQALKVSLNAKVVLFFGQIKTIKGLDLLLWALKRVVASYPDVILLIAGKVVKDDFKRYQGIIKEQNLYDHCLLNIDYIPNYDVPCYYAASDLVVLPYRKIYQSGALLMAMSFGKPVLASDLPGMTEIITDGQTGFIFPSGDVAALSQKIIQILSDPERTRKVALQGHQYIKEKYSWNLIGKMTKNLYSSIISNSCVQYSLER